MGFQTPQYLVSKYLEWTTSGIVQLPDFQRGYKWEDDRIRELLVTILRGHPMGIVLLLATNGDQVRFKPKPIEGTSPASDAEPQYLLLDGQQRLTSLTQALTGDGVVATKDARGQAMSRKYYIHLETALLGEERIDEAVISMPADGVRRINFARDIELDLSTPELEREHGYFPARLLFDPQAANAWLWGLGDPSLGQRASAEIVGRVQTYNIPAIELDRTTSKAAVATVFEKVNTGGLPLNVFELLTATFAGDASFYARTGTDFRLNDDWHELQAEFQAEPTLRALESTDFLQAVTLLATRQRNLEAVGSARPPAISAKREDVLKLTLDEYLTWRAPLAEAFHWVAAFLADQHIFDVRFLPYPKQLVPLAAIRAVLGRDADLHGVRQRITQWFWCGILGELYGGAIETRFVRDIERVPAWARGDEAAGVPRTIEDAGFQESRLYSLRTRGSAAYKGIYALLLHHGAQDWMLAKSFDKVQYAQERVDIHHIFPHKWCVDRDIDPVLRESIVNKTPLAAQTNRAIGGQAPSSYLGVIERRSGIESAALDALLESHVVDAEALRNDDFDAHFEGRKLRLIELIEAAMGKSVARNQPDEDLIAIAGTFDEVATMQEDEDQDADGTSSGV